MRSIFALLLCSCATTGAQVKFRPPHWPGFAEAKSEAICAVRNEYGARVAEDMARIEVIENDDPPYTEYVVCETCPNPKIVIDSDLSDGRAAAKYRHAIFAHMVPKRIGLSLNYGHKDDRANAVEFELRLAVTACREGQVRASD